MELIKTPKPTNNKGLKKIERIANTNVPIDSLAVKLIWQITCSFKVAVSHIKQTRINKHRSKYEGRKRQASECN
jgi:hypothetical protein